MPPIVPPIEFERLSDLASHLMAQRQLKRSVLKLHQTIGDMRFVIQQIILKHYIQLPVKEEERFEIELNASLDGLKTRLRDESFDKVSSRYCIKEISSAFACAKKLKHRSNSAPTVSDVLRKLPILKPFNLNLRPFLKVVTRGS